jgi:hypothetical protein
MVYPIGEFNMTIEVGAGGGLRPPTSLENIEAQGAASFSNNMGTAMATNVSSTITSATLTEVLNISGSGVLTFSAVSCTSNLTDYKITIVIDGVTVLSELAGGVLNSSQAAFQVGAFVNLNDIASLGMIVFNSSLVVEIAGDATNGAIYHYKRYLT